jgi:dTDP-4-dehydrorhamnose 3,5-epimerase
MNATETKIPGVLILRPEKHPDDRGYFIESFNERQLHVIGIKSSFVQDNQSFSLARGTVRGLHFQLPPFSQAKIVRVVRGSIFDVAVDLRVGAPTFGSWIGQRLSAEGGEQLYIPRGLAHGFCTLEPRTEVLYKVDSYYSKEHESGLIWNDTTLAIEWPIASTEAVLSDKDRQLPPFANFESPFSYDGVSCAEKSS